MKTQCLPGLALGISPAAASRRSVSGCMRRKADASVRSSVLIALHPCAQWACIRGTATAWPLGDGRSLAVRPRKKVPRVNHREKSAVNGAAAIRRTRLSATAGASISNSPSAPPVCAPVRWHGTRAHPGGAAGERVTDILGAGALEPREPRPVVRHLGPESRPAGG